MNYSLDGRYKVEIVNSRTGIVRWRSPKWERNLIMNNGMNKIASSALCDCFTYAIAGDGTQTGDKKTSDFGSTLNCTVGGAVTRSGGTFTFDTVLPGDVYNYIKWDSTGFTARIEPTGLTTTSCIVTPAPSLAQSGNAVVYRVNRNTLQSEIKRVNTYVASAPYCSTVIIGNMLIHQRTWNFPEEVGTVAYKEMGVGWSGTLNDTGDPLGGTVFARFLLHGVTTVNAGENLRLLYQLRMVLDPVVPRAKTAAITGWPVSPATNTDGDEQIQLIGLSAIASSGATTFYDTGGYANEPFFHSSQRIWLSTSSTALAALGSCVNRYSGSFSKVINMPTYDLFDFSTVKQVDLSSGEGNSTSWRTMGMGWGSTAAQYNTQAFLFDQAQTKSLTHTLNLQFFFSWDRVLSPSSV